MKKKLMLFQLVLLAAGMLTLPLACKNDSDEEVDTTPSKTAKYNKDTGQRVFNYLYSCVEDADPRVALGYQLEDGTPFFDAIIIFAAALRDRDCANDTPTVTSGYADGNPAMSEHINGSDTHSCTKTGLHVHLDNAVKRVLDERETYIKPFQDKGVKVLLGTLGDWSGVDFGTFGEWPMEDVSPVASASGHTGKEIAAGTSGPGLGQGSPWAASGYPYTDEARRAWLQELKDVVDQYKLDGIDFDGEWGSKGPYEYDYVYPKTSGTLWRYGNQYNVWRYYNVPDGTGAELWGSSGVADANLRGGINFGTTIIEAREIFGPDYTILVYEWNYARYIPQYIEYKGKMVRVSDYYDYSGEAAYGSWAANSYISTPASKYAPVGIDLGGGDAARVRPSWDESSGSSIQARMKTHRQQSYGANLFYCLLSRGRYDGTYTQETLTVARPPKVTAGMVRDLADKTGFYNKSATDDTNCGPEGYLSIISQELFGQNTIYVGDNYDTWENLRYIP